MEPRKHRIPIMLSDSELQMIDDWRFANRIPTRSGAIRRLVEAGMVKNLKAIKDARGSRAAFEGDED